MGLVKNTSNDHIDINQGQFCYAQLQSSDKYKTSFSGVHGCVKMIAAVSVFQVATLGGFIYIASKSVVVSLQRGDTPKFIQIFTFPTFSKEPFIVWMEPQL